LEPPQRRLAIESLMTTAQFCSVRFCVAAHRAGLSSVIAAARMAARRVAQARTAHRGISGLSRFEINGPLRLSLCLQMGSATPPKAGTDTRTLQGYLGHRSIRSTVPSLSHRRAFWSQPNDSASAAAHDFSVARQPRLRRLPAQRWPSRLSGLRRRWPVHWLITAASST
jgi:hypothetical protein